MQISMIRYYPLKAAAGINVEAAQILATGLAGDRRFILVDSAGQFITQRSLPSLVFLRMVPPLPQQSEAQSQGFHLEYAPPGAASPRIFQFKSADHSQVNQTVSVRVWNDKVMALDLGDDVAAYLLGCFGQNIRLCEAISESPRWVNPKYSEGAQVPYFFADGFPLLVISQESLDDLNERLVSQHLAPVAMDRFRPNLVIKGWKPYGEDDSQYIKIGDSIVARLAKPCSRCSVITVDQTKGHVSSEPLKTLASYRKGQGGKVFFGQNAYVVSGIGQWVRLNDAVTLL